jgi:hypothetical protein
MKRATFALNFYIKRKKLLAIGEAPIFLRVTVNGQQSEFAVKRSIKADDWDRSKVRSARKTKEAIALNEYLDEVVARLHAVRRELEHKNSAITALAITDR